MRNAALILCAGLIGLSIATSVQADALPAVSKLKPAIERAVALIEKSAARYRAQRQCFSCHHQALPVLTLVEAQKHGFAIDTQNLRDQIEHTRKHLQRNQDNYRKGRGQGGQVDTAGYALWTLFTAGEKDDEITEAVTEYLLLRDKDRDHWRCSGTRPPSEASDFTTSALAVLSLQVYGTEEQKERLEPRTKKIREWYLRNKGTEVEDKVFRLWALSYLDVEKNVLEAAVRELVSLQRPDGGWAQRGDMTGDAYATGSVLVALHQAGGLPVTAPAYVRGVRYLLETQWDDGSWYVKSRSRPFQIYFESGFPHGKDQFISISGSCWAASALILATPVEKKSVEAGRE